MLGVRKDTAVVNELREIQRRKWNSLGSLQSGFSSRRLAMPLSRRFSVWRRRFALIALALAGLAASNATWACPINAPGVLPTYGAFATGGIGNSAAASSCTPGYNIGTLGTGTYYIGTDINPFTYANSPAVGSASSALGTASWGMSSASADLSTGNITVS